MSHFTLLSSVAVATLVLIGTAANADQVINDDLIVTGSICAGFDCVNGESFGFDTLRLKENNLRIRAFDTSSTASFPTIDWQITFNDTTNGGASKFAIDNIDRGTTPFTIRDGAKTNALFIDSASRIGIGTGTPVVNLHVVSGNTPTLRLDQDGTSGFTPQVWDVAGNETNFFIRDATNGSRLPLRIQPNAPTNSLFIAASGNVGVGAGTSPGAKLHVLQSGSAFAADPITAGLFQSNAAAGDAVRLTLLSGNTGNSQLAFGDTDNEIAGRIRYNHSADTMDFFTNGGNRAITLNGSGAGNVITTATSGAVLTAAGVWQSVSSRAAKQNIHSLTLSDAQAALRGLEPVTYNYKVEPDELTVGFIAEDVPALVATASRKTLSALDIVAVLTRVVQDQQAIIGTLEERLLKLENAQ